MPSRSHSVNMSLSLAAPSSIEYSVCTWRCTNESDIGDGLPWAERRAASILPPPPRPAGIGHTDYSPLLPVDRKPQLSGSPSRLSANTGISRPSGGLPPSAAGGRGQGLAVMTVPEARMHVALSTIHERLSRYDEAEHHARRAVALTDLPPHGPVRVQALTSL